MNNDTTNPLALKDGHESMMIPRYINPVLETSQPTPSIEMTSSSRDTNHDVNGNTMPKITGMAKLPYAAVTQQPQCGQGVLEVFGGRDERSQRHWSTGLFSCFDDWSSCLLGFICPCCLAMTISCSLNECCCTTNCYPVATRTKIRTEYDIVGTICEDAYIMCWCYQCALCQMAREIDASSPENYTE